MINSLYVHIPFCKRICNYCDFSKILYSEEMAQDYLKSLENEIKEYNFKQKFKTIYIGGGTPSSLPPKQLEFLLALLSEFLNEEEYEFSIECNPADIDIEKIYLLKKYGVNRISLGVQTFNNGLLKILDRNHSKDHIRFALDMFQHAGFNNISIDLIYGLPKQNIRKIRRDLNAAVKMKVNHISAYSLTIEKNTVFHIKGIKECPQEVLRKYYDYILDYLRKKGFHRYEVSNFAYTKFESQHNLTYWRNQEYFGIGLNAHSYVGNQRYSNTKSLTEYNKMNYDRHYEKISKMEMIKEEIMLKLRLSEGIYLQDFKNKYKIDLVEFFSEAISQLVKEKLIEVTKTQIFATDNGIMLLDTIISKFYQCIKED